MATLEKPEGAQIFQKLVETHQNSLTRYAVSIVHSLEVSREVVQDVFLSFWKHQDQIHDSAVKVWLFKSCRNSCIDYLRKENRMSHFNEGDQESIECPNELPSVVMEKEEAQKNILKKIENLPSKHREVLRLKFQEDLSYKEISEITGCTVNHVGVLIHQGVLKLRESLAIQGGH